ncbi:phage tail sheath subtilisin-like domain-containing protein [Sporomusa carbonis]|uniref:phage tail sheath subtilisin-like domain-containing protein n=1 Tax=Sporomusa carbonis TaxID=3076075 RepID=UPI003C7AA567
MEFIVPGVQIDESDVGPRPTQQLSLSGIGIVGTFERGPLNTPTTVGDIQQLTDKFGGYVEGLTGYVSAYGALVNGANDLRIVRIAGAGSAAASKTFTDGAANPSIVVTASSVGAWGNGIKIGIAKNADNFDLTLKYGSAVERYAGLTLNTLAKVTSKFITVSKAEGAEGMPETVPDTSLTGGNDGAAPTDADYIGKVDSATGARSGLKALEPVQVGIVLCAQQYSPQIHTALVSFCENCDLDEGLRVAILNTAPGLSVDAAIAQTQALDSDRGIFVYPWVEPEDLPGQFVAPDGYYAGRLSVINPHESPSNKQILGITSCENMYTYAEVKALTLARISPITLVNNRGFRIRNGLTLSSDSAWSQTNIRRQQDKMEMEVYHALQWAISEPHAEPLWRAVADQVDMYLQVQKNLGFIRGYKPTLCDANTNPPEMVTARILTFILRWLPLYAADYIVGRMKREMSVENK